MNRLETLNLAQNQLESLPESLGALERLRMLDLGHNRLAKLPAATGALRHLEFLYTSHNQLSRLLPALADLYQLRYLNLSDNHFTRLPAWISRLENRVELRLYHNILAALPDETGMLTNLVELHAQGNQLAALPDSLGRLEALNRLNLESNHLIHLPESIGGLSCLSDPRRADMDRLGLQIGVLTAIVGSNAFVLEPVFYWPAPRTLYYERVLDEATRAKFEDFAPSPEAEALVFAMRGQLTQLFMERGATHLQIGRTYRYRKGLRPEPMRLLEAIKRAVDPNGVVNPGSLGLR